MNFYGSDSFLGSFLVYINGVRVPALSVSVDVTTNSPASANIQIPADPILFGLGEEDLCQVAIFYLDQSYRENPTYCLLFEGRLVSLMYQNEPSGESMSISVESNMAILSDLSLKFFV